MERNLGDLGESTLEKWCAEVGITVNRVKRDRTGWDHLIEFPLSDESTDDLPLDRRAPNVQCLIQVKGTDSKRKSKAVTLSNWTHLARSALPAFFLVQEYDGLPVCQRAYLIHVDQDKIRKLLRRLRVLSAEGNFNDVHKRTMSFKYSETDALTSLRGEGLAESIRRHIGPDYVSYVKNKQQFQDDVGYEDGRTEINVNFIVPESYSENPKDLLVDFSIGSVKSLQITSAKFWDTRFGIKGIKPEREISEGGELSVTDGPRQDGVLLLRANELGRETRIPATLHAPFAVAHLVDRSRLKFRIVFPAGEMVLARFAESAQFSCQVPDTAAEQPLDELAVLADLFIFLEDVTSPPSVPVELIWDDILIGRVTFNELRLPEDIRDWCQLVFRMKEVVAAFNLPGSIDVCTLDLLRQRNALSVMQRAIRNDCRGIRITFTLVERAETCCSPIFYLTA